MVLYLCSGCCSYGWFYICVLIVVVMDSLIFVVAVLGAIASIVNTGKYTISYEF